MEGVCQGVGVGLHAIPSMACTGARTNFMVILPLIMNRDRLEKLSQYIHVQDCTGFNQQDPNRDKLHLIRPLFEIVNKQCLGNYSPSRENAVDEAMIKFCETLSFRQYMPAKSTKYGIKVLERANSKNGYVCEFEVYLGKPGRNHGREKNSEEWFSNV